MVKIKKASCKNFASWEASGILIMFSFATYDSESHFLSFNNTIQENVFNCFRHCFFKIKL